MKKLNMSVTVGWMCMIVYSFLTAARDDCKSQTITSPSENSLNSQESALKPDLCNEFFFGQPFPMPKEDRKGLVKLCQTQAHEGYSGPSVYATLYSTEDRIPVYSANVIALYPNSSDYTRPDSSFWKRLSLSLCGLKELPSHAIESVLGTANESIYVTCGQLQATDNDYKGSSQALHLDRGHLNPNSINSQDLEKQIATFTLTNAAPQVSSFNEITWRAYECMTKHVIMQHVPMERVYIMTGTMGVAKDENNNPFWMNDNGEEHKNRVKVPGYYWKAVCYPGNPWTGMEAWSYAILHENAANTVSTPAHFMTVKKFSSAYFKDDLFGTVCLNAPSMGPIVSYFKSWGDFTLSVCGVKLDV